MAEPDTDTDTETDTQTETETETETDTETDTESETESEIELKSALKFQLEQVTQQNKILQDALEAKEQREERLTLWATEQMQVFTETLKLAHQVAETRQIELSQSEQTIKGQQDRMANQAQQLADLQVQWQGLIEQNAANAAEEQPSVRIALAPVTAPAPVAVSWQARPPQLQPQALQNLTRINTTNTLRRRH